MTEKKRNKWIGIILILIVLAGAGIGWALLQDDGFHFDEAAEDGSLDGMSEQEIKDMLKDKVDKSMLSISINANPVFENGKSKGTLRIENPPGNNYNIRVRIVKDEDQKEIYYSEGIRPGQVIKEDHLDETLKKGSYACTAIFEAYDTETDKKVGEAKAQLNIVVEG